jgi:hypothetical protein
MVRQYSVAANTPRSLNKEPHLKCDLCSFDPEQSSDFQAFWSKVRECGDSQEAAEEEDEDLHMERGNDLAPNRTCPLCQKEVGGPCSYPFERPDGFRGVISAHNSTQPSDQVTFTYPPPQAQLSITPQTVAAADADRACGGQQGVCLREGGHPGLH